MCPLCWIIYLGNVYDLAAAPFWEDEKSADNPVLISPSSFEWENKEIRRKILWDTRERLFREVVEKEKEQP
jgi:hypothetical protein